MSPTSYQTAPPRINLERHYSTVFGIVKRKFDFLCDFSHFLW
ncbi:hypothetical protein [Moraxella lacunata]